MKDKTTYRRLGGTWYQRVPPAFARHIGLPENPNEGDIVDGEIQDETSKHGNYTSSWVTPQKKEEQINKKGG
jgi:hypothetical protein